MDQYKKIEKSDITYPIVEKDVNGNITYIQNKDGWWSKSIYENGKQIYYENSNGYCVGVTFGKFDQIVSVVYHGSTY